MAALGLALSVFVPPAGLVLSIIGLRQIKKTGEGGRGLAIAGLVISAIFMVVASLAIILALMAVPKMGQVARDTERKNDLAVLQSKLEEHRLAKGYYPSGLDELAVEPHFLKDPDPDQFYSYMPMPADCTKCTNYELTAILTDGQTYKVKASD